MFGTIKGILGVGEHIPAGIASKTFYQLQAELPGTGKFKDFADYKGKVVLVVNTASKCGFTPQYTGLEKLYKDFHEQGFEVIGFPSNEFLGQEPGNDDDIAQFCQVNHGVTFPLAKKSEVNGNNMNEVFAWLKSQKTGQSSGIGGQAVKWNFTKWLVDRNGQVFARYSPSTEPKAITADIEKLLSQ